jgi:hypothetical protein
MSVWVLMWWSPGFAGDEDCAVYGTKQLAENKLRGELQFELAGAWTRGHMSDAVKDEIGQRLQREDVTAANEVYDAWLDEYAGASAYARYQLVEREVSEY